MDKLFSAQIHFCYYITSSNVLNKDGNTRLSENPRPILRVSWHPLAPDNFILEELMHLIGLEYDKFIFTIQSVLMTGETLNIRLLND